MTPARRRFPVLRVLFVLVLTAATLLVLSALLADVQVKNFGAALAAAAAIGLLNAFVWPVIIRFALPLTVLTLGLGVVILNGALVLAVSAVQPRPQGDSAVAGGGGRPGGA